MKQTDKRTRRTEEQRIAQLEEQIVALRAKAEAKKVQKDPSLKHITAAVRNLDKALSETKDNATRTALQEARSALSACLSLGGAAPIESRGSATKRAPRASQGSVDSDTLFTYVVKHPGSRGEQIAAALGTDVNTMRPFMKRLIEDRKVQTRGQRRGMTYSAS